MTDKVMVGVTEYGEGMDVKLGYDKGRPVIIAFNEGGYASTFVDLIQLLYWVRKKMPELQKEDAMTKTAANKGIRNKISKREMEILVEYLLANVGQKDLDRVLTIVNELREMDAKEQSGHKEPAP